MKRKITAILIAAVLALSTFSSFMVFGSASSIETLEDVIKAIESANESDYTAETWAALQENYNIAKRLSGEQEYFAIRADVPNGPTVLWDSGWPSGHNNYNKYVSIVEDSTQAYLAYKGHGANDYEKADFSADQLWEKVTVDEDRGIFMLRNVEQDMYLCGHRQDGTWGESAHQYFYLLKLSEIADMTRAQFTFGDDSILRIEYVSSSGGVYVDMIHSNDTLRSGGIQGLFTFPELALTDPRSSSPKCVFEAVDVSTVQLDTEKETQKAIENTRALLDLNLNDFLKPLSREVQSAKGDLPRHYTDSADYQALQDALDMAESLMNGGLIRIVHDNTAFAMTPTTDGRICLSSVQSNNLAQVWYRLEQSTDQIAFLNASTGGYLYHSNEQLSEYAGLVDFGYYLKLAGFDAFSAEPDAALFKIAAKNNLQPLLPRSETVDQVTVAFMNPDGVAFTTAGMDEGRAIHLSIADTSVLKSQASKLLAAIRKIREHRLDSMDSTLSDLNKLLKKAAELDQGLYTETTWNALLASCESAKEVAKSKNPTTAQINLAVDEVEQAIEALKRSDDVIPAGDKAYTDATNEIQPLYTIFSSKSYVKATADRARTAMNAALTAAADGAKGSSLITFGQLDQLCLAAKYAYEYLVENQHYTQLVNTVSSITNRASSPEGYIIRLNESQYQPDTWSALQTAYDAANAILLRFDQNIWETPSTDVRNAAANLNSAISALANKPDYTVLSGVVELLDNVTVDSSVFTEDSWSAYETVYRVSKELIGDEYAGQVAIDALTNELIIAANSLKIDGVDGEVSLLPGLSVKVNSSVIDRYDTGYEEGYLDGTSGQYVTGFNQGSQAAQSAYEAALNRAQQTNVKKEVPDAVEEVTSVINKDSKKNTLLEDSMRIWLPTWLILILVGAAVVIIALGFLTGFLITKGVAKRKKAKTAKQ